MLTRPSTLLYRFRPEVHRMGDWLAAKLESLGVKVEKRPLGKQMLEGQELDLPAALLGELGNDPNKVRLFCRKIPIAKH
jgi:Cys-Gly metallodipeptidase DUG1